VVILLLLKNLPLLISFPGTRFLFTVIRALGTKEGCLPEFVACAIGYTSLKGEAREEKGVTQVQMTIDSELYIDSGLLSGLAAMSEIRELLDELYSVLA
jgi:hypothetical protein